MYRAHEEQCWKIEHHTRTLANYFRPSWGVWYISNKSSKPKKSKPYTAESILEETPKTRQQKVHGPLKFFPWAGPHPSACKCRAQSWLKPDCKPIKLLSNCWQGWLKPQGGQDLPRWDPCKMQKANDIVWFPEGGHVVHYLMVNVSLAF